jgi:hypothetical protein
MEDRGLRMEDGGWRMEDRGLRMEDGGSRMEDRQPSIVHRLSSIFSSTLFHSYLSAIIGSTFVDLRAGM